MKSILGATKNSLGYGAEKLASQGVGNIARETVAMDLALPRIPNAGKTELHIKYIKPHPNPDVVPYDGITSGMVTDVNDIEQLRRIVVKRDRNHKMNPKGFEAAEIEAVSTNRNAIRGLEQIGLDFHGGAQSTGGTSSNAINSIHIDNPNMRICIDAAVEEFY